MLSRVGSGPSLRESAALFEAPHVVGLIHRPRLGAFDPCPACGGSNSRGCFKCEGAGGTSLDTEAVITLAKNRSGPCGIVQLAWRGECMRFAPLVKESRE